MVHRRGHDTAGEADRTSRATPTPGTVERAESDEARDAVNVKRIGHSGEEEGL